MTTRQRGGQDLELHEVGVRRRGLQLIEGLNLTLRPGEVLGVSGPSGCGKTSLLRTIAGLDAAEFGRMQIPSGRIGYVFQDARLLPWRTAVQNVALAVGKSAYQMQVARDWIARVGLADAADLYPASLSGGMRQRIAIARAMAIAPRILLVDEPFSALDESLATKLRSELRSVIAERELITVWVSHDPAELDEAATSHLALYGPPGTWTHTRKAATQ